MALSTEKYLQLFVRLRPQNASDSGAAHLRPRVFWLVASFYELFVRSAHSAPRCCSRVLKTPRTPALCAFVLVRFAIMFRTKLGRFVCALRRLPRPPKRLGLRCCAPSSSCVLARKSIKKPSCKRACGRFLYAFPSLVLHL